MCCGSKLIKVSRAQWIVRPHPRPHVETVASLSKITYGTLCLLNAWASTRPVIPAPDMRTFRECDADEGVLLLVDTINFELAWIEYTGGTSHGKGSLAPT